MVRKAGLLVLGLAVVGLTGCSSKSTTSPTDALSAEQASVQMAVAAVPELASDGLFDSSTPAGFSAHAGTGPLTGVEGDGGGGPETQPTAPSTERHWWRVISDATRSFDYEFTETDSTGRPTRAHVTVHKHFTGTFHVTWGEVVTGSAGQDSVVMHETVKPLKDHWVRQLWLARVARHGDGRDWKLVAASGVDVTSEIDDPARQPAIQSVRVQAEGVDSTFTDPAAAITWNKLWCAPPATPVTITVTTNAPDDVVVLMHHDSRSPLTANGDNTYTATWMTPNYGGLKHVGVNALNPATVSDPEVAYHSHAWVFPYLNRGEGYGS